MSGGAGPGDADGVEVETRAVLLLGRDAGPLSSLLDRLRQTLRPSDHVCPVGPDRVAVAFGPDAAALPPHRLAGRLAEAARYEPDGSGPAVAAPPVVTIDRVVRGAPGAPGAPGGTSVALARRTVTHFEGDEVLPTAEGWAAGVTVGVVELPMPAPDRNVGMVASTVARSVERTGARAIVPPGDGPDTVQADAVVLVIDPERRGGAGGWETSAWKMGAEVAERHVHRGAVVLAMAAGADAGALAACSTGGAVPVADLSAVEAALRALVGQDLPGTAATPLTGEGAEAVGRIASLTRQERRVLFELTLGRSPSEIADALTVSVTTVRSHIRGILSKLGVRSQLAAVAAANLRVAPTLL